MDDMDAQAEKHLDRLKKLLALAASTVNEHEAALAAQRAADYLAKNPIPVRWLVPAGTICRVFPMAYLSSLTAARAALRDIPAPKTLVFTEAHRVKDQTANALTKKAQLYFQRHSYCILISVKDVQAYF